MKIKSMEEVYKIIDFEPDEEKKKVIECIEGPLLVIAGPGSGKTHAIVLRCINLLLFKKVPPEKIMLCTYTEKAAEHLKEILTNFLTKLDVDIDVNEIYTGTIHSIWADILDEYLDKAGLVKGYTILDDLTQKLFFYENSYNLFEKKYQPFANSKWGAIEVVSWYCNRITEELIDVKKMKDSKDEFDKRLAEVYDKYIGLLKENNAIDFANLQKYVYDILQKDAVRKELLEKFSYIMVDEYQDTNYIQEALFLELTKKSQNLCVVGDDDQSLYRFRGATVQNIIEFEKNFKKIEKRKLEKNYRSQPAIVNFYNDYMSEIPWEENNKSFRHKKIIMPERKDNNCASVLKFDSDSHSKIARLVKELYSNKVIEDYNQIAILLKSVAYDGPEFIEAFKKLGIDSYAPRIRGFFELKEIKAIIGSLISVFKYNPEDCWLEELGEYYKECIKSSKEITTTKAKEVIKKLNEEIANLEDKPELNSLKKGVVDLFYEILGESPFSKWVDEEVIARNIAILSDHLTKFQAYYHLPAINYSNRERTVERLFGSFIYILWKLGMDEYEDPYEIFPSGKVQILTIHQSKGLEFPIVIVNSLHKHYTIREKSREERLEKYKIRKSIETHDQKRAFDHSRMFYVAFSRARDLLILGCDKKINKRFTESYDKIPEAESSLIKPILKLKYKSIDHSQKRREFGVTSDIHAYDVCPKQYKHYAEYGFVPSRGGQFMFGSLVHNAIEEIHRYHIKNKKKELKDSDIEAIFYRIYRGLTKEGLHPLAQVFLDQALGQIKSYYKLNKELMKKIFRAEEAIHLPKEDYDMVGVIDLIRGDKGKLELLDFKAQTIPNKDLKRLEFYRFQLALYAKIIERKLKEKPHKAYIYWTSEEVDVDKRLDEVDISKTKADEAESHFDKIAKKIINKDFEVKHKPDRDTCRNCDFRYGCSYATQ